MLPTVAAVTGCVTGGLFAGALHAVAGPDHLAALLPRTVGQRWYRAGRVGALWGMGHGISATLLGVVAFLVKRCTSGTALGGRVTGILSRVSHGAEIAVGLSLIFIGVMGMKEAREWEEEAQQQQQQKSLSAAAVPAHYTSSTSQDAAAEMQKRAVICNGLLHGFSWDGAPSLAPALAVATWSGNLAFLSAYAAGTTAAMALTTTLIGEGTTRAGEIFQRPDLPQKLSLGSSWLAMLIGVVWCGLAFV